MFAHASKLAHTPDQFRSLTAGADDWFIRSHDDLDRHLDGILAHVPPDAVKSFKDSLKFARGGLAHAEYGSLVDHLTVSQFRDLFARFGISPVLMREYNDKYCSNTAGSHICDNQMDHLCTSNCGY